MQPAVKIKKEHVIIKNKLDELDTAIEEKADRAKIKKLLLDFEVFWSQHEEREEKYFDWFAEHGGEFPFHKTIITQHQDLKGHWKVIKSFLENKNDSELEVALETDGKMILDKFRSHMNKENEYLDKYFKKF